MSSVISRWMGWPAHASCTRTLSVPGAAFAARSIPECLSNPGCLLEPLRLLYVRYEDSDGEDLSWGKLLPILHDEQAGEGAVASLPRAIHISVLVFTAGSLL